MRALMVALMLAEARPLLLLLISAFNAARFLPVRLETVDWSASPEVLPPKGFAVAALVSAPSLNALGAYGTC